MSFIPKTWVDDQIVYAEDMNRIEQGIADAVSFTSQTLTDAQKTQARGNIGAAPAGYGLGGNGHVVDDWNTCLSNGWYQGNRSTLNGPDKISASGYGAMLVVTRYTNTYQLFVNAAKPYALPQTMARRWTEDGGVTWSEWEYINPPMQLGVEYRTTERINGKAVYKQNFDGVIHYRLDGETKWKPYVNAVGGDYRVSGSQELWVSNSGSDTTGDGSQSNPFATIQHAIDSASKNLSGNGLYIRLNPGTYNENVSISGFYGTRGWEAMKIIGGSSIEEAENYKVSSITIEGSISGTVAIEGINFTTSETGMPCIVSRGACLAIGYCISEAGASRFLSIDSCELGWASIANCRVSNIKDVVILSSELSLVLVRWCSGSNNAALYKTSYGGIIKLVGTCTWTGTKTWINEASGNALATGASWIFTATIPASGWTANGSEGYTQTVNISDIFGSDYPNIGPVLNSSTLAGLELIKEEWGKIICATTINGGITFYASDRPTIDIPIQIQCVR